MRRTDSPATAPSWPDRDRVRADPVQACRVELREPEFARRSRSPLDDGAPIDRTASPDDAGSRAVGSSLSSTHGPRRPARLAVSIFAGRCAPHPRAVRGSVLASARTVPTATARRSHRPFRRRATSTRRDASARPLVARGGRRIEALPRRRARDGTPRRRVRRQRRQGERASTRRRTDRSARGRARGRGAGRRAGRGGRPATPVFHVKRRSAHRCPPNALRRWRGLPRAGDCFT